MTKPKHDANGFTWVKLSEDGQLVPLTKAEANRAIEDDAATLMVDQDGILWRYSEGSMIRVVEAYEDDEDPWADVFPQERINQHTLSDDYLELVDDDATYRTWEDDNDLDHRSDYRWPFQLGYEPKDYPLGPGPRAW